VTSRAAVVYAHKNETIDVITSKIAATGALAVPVLKYSFGIINRRTEEIKRLTGKIGRC
jgi:hypothetical protein